MAWPVLNCDILRSVSRNIPNWWFYPLNTSQISLLTSSHLGSILPTKKFSEFWKFPWIFKMCSYKNILRKIFRNLSSQQHQNIFYEKIGGFKIFRFLLKNFSELRFLLTGQPQITCSNRSNDPNTGQIQWCSFQMDLEK